MHRELFFLFGDYDFKSRLCFEERDAGCKAHDSCADDEYVAVDRLFVRGGGHGGSLCTSLYIRYVSWDQPVMSSLSDLSVQRYK